MRNSLSWIVSSATTSAQQPIVDCLVRHRRPYPNFLTTTGIQTFGTKLPQHLFASERKDDFLADTVTAWRAWVLEWLKSHQDDLRKRFAIKGKQYADRQMEDIAAEIRSLGNQGWVGDKGAMTTLRMVLEEQHPDWWNDTGFKLLYYGSSSAGAGIAGSLIEVLPWNLDRGVEEYCQPAKDRTWPARASAQANHNWGLKTPSVLYDDCPSLSEQPVAIFGNVVKGHFEAILHVPDVYSSTQDGYICYRTEDVVVTTMPTVETMRYYTEVPRLSMTPHRAQLSPGPALEGALRERLYPTESAGITVSDDPGGGEPAKLPPVASATPVYDFAAYLPVHLTRAMSAAEKCARIFGDENGEDKRKR